MEKSSSSKANVSMRNTNIVIVSDDDNGTMSDNETMDFDTRSVISGCTTIGEAFKNIQLEHNYVEFNAGKNSAKFQTTSFHENSVRIGLLPKGSNLNSVNYPHTRTIEEAVLDIAEEQKDIAPRVQFLGCQCGFGFLIMICASQETADWLKQNIHIVSAKTQYKLKAVDEADFPNSVIMHGYFRHSSTYSTAKILRRIEISNKNLDTKKWSVLKRTESRDTTHLIILIDNNSAEAIDLEKGYIFYRFSQIKVKFERPFVPKSSKKPKNKQRHTVTVSRQTITQKKTSEGSSKTACKQIVATKTYERKKPTNIEKQPCKLFISPWQHQESLFIPMGYFSN